MKYYALRFKESKRLATYYLSGSSDMDETGADVSVVLTDNEHFHSPVWLATSRSGAEMAIEAGPEWWHSVQNPFPSDTFEIVEVELTVKETTLEGLFGSEEK